ncbi:MAG: hypothetical protein ACBR50_22920 [Microcoleus sp.]
MVSLRQSNPKKMVTLYSGMNDLLQSPTNFSNKVAEVGLLQAIRNSAEGYLLTLVHDRLYRPIDRATGLRVKNPFDGCNGNGTGGTTKARINLMIDPKNTLWSVSFDYYKSFLSYRRPETHIEHFLEPLVFFKWYFFVALGMTIAYPAIRTIEKEFPQQGEKLKIWYASTPIYQQSECDVVVK